MVKFSVWAHAPIPAAIMKVKLGVDEPEGRVDSFTPNVTPIRAALRPCGCGAKKIKIAPDRSKYQRCMLPITNIYTETNI